MAGQRHCSKCGARVVFERPALRGPKGLFRAKRKAWVDPRTKSAACPRGMLHETAEDN